MFFLTQKQHLKTKSSIVDSNNYLNKVFPSFNKEFPLGFFLVDTFSDCFLFNIVNCKDIKAKTAYQKKLNKIFDDSISNPNTVIVISDASIKNNVATSSSYIYNNQNIIAKSIHHAINVTSTKVELFTIRYRINQAIQVPNIEQIIVITDAIPATRHIFDLSTHSYQLHSITISQDLRLFFNKNFNNSILFWDCSSSDK